MTRRRPWAVVPVKDFRRGKSRLGSILTDVPRAAFARSLFEHVTGVLDAAELSGVLVLTDDDAVADAAAAAGCSVRMDVEGTPLSGIVDAGLQEVEARGADAALVCMADLPRLSVADVRQVLQALDNADVVVVPDMHQVGTNVLCLSPPTRLASCFGKPDSYQRHLSAARRAGARLCTLQLERVSFDVDGPEDLATLL